MALEVTAVDHIYIAVTDMDRSERFYDSVMRLLGFRKGTKAINNQRHLHYFNPVTQYTVRPARTGASPHDPHSPGLHHVCFRVSSPEDVDAVAQAPHQVGIEVADPKFYPEHAPDYYAAFFADPDGIRLEVVAHRRLRSLIRDKWHEPKEFEDPLTKAGLI